MKWLHKKAQKCFTFFPFWQPSPRPVILSNDLCSSFPPMLKLWPQRRLAAKLSWIKSKLLIHPSQVPQPTWIWTGTLSNPPHPPPHLWCWWLWWFLVTRPELTVFKSLTIQCQYWSRYFGYWHPPRVLDSCCCCCITEKQANTQSNA